VGIDHAFSLPKQFCEQIEAANWPEVLNLVAKTWPCHLQAKSVETVLAEAGAGKTKSDLRSLNTALRLCEKWTASAKSVFLFDVQGSVAKSTFAGLPWLRQIREATKNRIHWWPFDGWDLPRGKSVVVEVYPALFKRRYSRGDRSADQHDAYAVARWLQEADQGGSLERYVAPPLSSTDQAVAEIEGWILGVT
jgi:hypothetical protein